MDSVASAMRNAVMPKFAQFHEVVSAIIPSLGESRSMQVPLLTRFVLVTCD